MAVSSRWASPSPRTRQPAPPRRRARLALHEAATHGTLEPTRCACGGRFILTLRGADAQIFKDVSLFIDGAGEPEVSDDQPDSI
jgi:hypothetical protein